MSNIDLCTCQMDGSSFCKFPHRVRRDAGGSRLYGLWSLDEMLRFTAARLFTSLLWLGSVNALAVGGEVSNADLRKKYREGLREVRKDSERCQLDHITDRIDHLLDTWLKGEEQMDIVVAMVASFVGEVQKELTSHIYFQIAKEERAFYELPQLTEAASNAFPSAVHEMWDAGRCFALDQPTASVLHSMRALEVPLSAMVTALAFQPSNPNWQVIINECEREIRGLKDRALQEFFSGAAANFLYFKNAWRNHAMHGRDTYDKQAAYEILTHVAGFMNHLSRRLCDPGGYTQ